MRCTLYEKKKNDEKQEKKTFQFLIFHWSRESFFSTIFSIKTTQFVNNDGKSANKLANNNRGGRKSNNNDRNKNR